eukprot:TRINITY_DN20825_c0_g1_i1.p1 TRINITY_DN20825_c0_g1~~TRINITY_DN20825_c0_g1_i1.p1  ORF type:complete len:556 (+),score=151.73 TRINITY_DN20825_c0_g1_i1:78-1745(+)
MEAFGQQQAMDAASMQMFMQPPPMMMPPQLQGQMPPMGMPPMPGMQGMPPMLFGAQPGLGGLPPPGMPPLLAGRPPAPQPQPPGLQRGGVGSAAAEAAPQAAPQVEVSQCHLHKKPNNKCKFCQRYKEAMNAAKEERAQAAKASGPGQRQPGKMTAEEVRSGPLELEKGFGLSPIIVQHISGSAHYKELLTFESLNQVVNEMYQYADGIEPYAQNSNTTPSALFCCLYRIFAMGIDARQLMSLMDDLNNPYVRCLGILFVRFGLAPDQLWPWLSDYTLDDAELVASKRADAVTTTVGEFVEDILTQDKYFSIVLPRLPSSMKRTLQERLAPVSQYRKRAAANKDLLEVYRREGIQVEANVEGEWLPGTTVDLMEDIPSRIKIIVKFEDERELAVHLGKIIITDKNIRAKPRRRSRSRSRGRGGGGSSGVDWSREKGRSDKELIDELRSKDRERAVCSSGKEYARKPLGYKAACALPSEMGAASARLIEEDTFVAQSQRPSARRRSPSPSQMLRKGPSAEYQAQQQKIFEKYGMARSSDGGGNRNLLEQPDLMRLG